MTVLMADPRPFVHHPVLLDRVLELFGPVPSGTVVDVTLGGAGHAVALLDAREDLRILGIDRDPQALAVARARLAPYGPRAEAHHARSDQLAAVVTASGAASQPIIGVLADLGVSSPQFDDADRGFSYRHDAPLDMRMDPTSGPSAADLVNTWSERDLAAVLRTNADERFASRIARVLVAARPVTTTGQLRDLVVGAIPAPARRTGGHPAKRTFQALRIAVNHELDGLGPTLDAALEVLAPGGRLVVISYHSGEDRIVKERFRRAEDGGCTCPPNLPCGCGAVAVARLLKRGGWVPDAGEIAANPRASSARLRAVEKLP
jgi:16S rRNA (cytosine1402-N4)-methyltransferase